MAWTYQVLHSYLLARVVLPTCLLALYYKKLKSYLQRTCGTFWSNSAIELKQSGAARLLRRPRRHNGHQHRGERNGKLYCSSIRWDAAVFLMVDYGILLAIEQGHRPRLPLLV